MMYTVIEIDIHKNGERRDAVSRR